MTIPTPVDSSLEFARHLDETDPLREWRASFLIPRRPDGSEAIYLCGNSLGLQPTTTRALLNEELDDWANLAVEAHFKGRRPWYSYHEQCRDAGERLVGARSGAGEVVMMNSLTLNLHLLMTSFYRPTRDRWKIMIEAPAFPSDRYAVQTHLAVRAPEGVDHARGIIETRPRPGEHTLRTEEIAATLDMVGDEVALVLLGGVNFLTGQALDMERITRLAHARGCVIGFDLAHAAGNLPLRLHDWNVDFAAWCSYKYLNAGPGAPAGAFVHERHFGDRDLLRFGGWWGNDPATRFRMHLERDFIPVHSAEAWQVSNPPILAMAPLKASLDLFDTVGMTALREKSDRLTPYLRDLIEQTMPGSGDSSGDHSGGGSGGHAGSGSHSGGGGGSWFEIITPRAETERGCQLSILVHDRPRERCRALEQAGVIADFREPNIIRVAPTPFYNTFEDAWRFARALSSL